MRKGNLLANKIYIAKTILIFKQKGEGNDECCI